MIPTYGEVPHGLLHRDSAAVWAKSDMRHRPTVGVPVKGLPLIAHLLDSVGVAERLWDVWVPTSVKEIIASEFEGDEDTAKVFLAVGAGLHDIGKASPAFQGKVDQFSSLISLKPTAYTPYKEGKPNYVAILSEHHTRVGANYLLNERRQCTQGGPPDQRMTAYDVLLYAVLGHHGRFANLGKGNGSPEILSGLTRAQKYGEEDWRNIRDDLADRVLREVGVGRDYLDALESRVLSTRVYILLCSLVTLSDWIASTEEILPLQHRSVWDGMSLSKTRGHEAVDSLELPEHWTPELPDSKSDDDLRKLFAKRFGSSNEPRAFQMDAMRVAMDETNPGLLLLEAPTGSGKTEAGLLAAEILAARHGRQGLLYAMPTQATTDSAFDRVASWLRSFDVASTSVALIHGNASVNDRYQELFSKKGSGDTVFLADTLNTCDSDHPNSIYEYAWGDVHYCDDHLDAHWWVSHLGKRILSSVVVSTVDTVLKACLTTERHLPMLHLGLASKVLVIDEVHASDTKMTAFLSRLLEWCGEYGIPVVLMTATATPKLRATLHTAYNRHKTVQLDDADSFPAITHSRRDNRVVTTTYSAGSTGEIDNHSVTFVIDPKLGTPESIADEAISAYQSGAVVAVVCNTVPRAQQVFEAVVRAVPDRDVTLSHSRFTTRDRAAKNSRVIEQAGRLATRTPYIVVATQTVEQALDIDFDFMISDIAPLDALIQRGGRVHRHSDTPRPDNHQHAVIKLAGVESAGTLIAGIGIPKVYPEWAVLSAVSWLGDTRVFDSKSDTPEVMRAIQGDVEDIPEEWHQRWLDSRDASNRNASRSLLSADVGILPRPRELTPGGLYKNPWGISPGNREIRETILPPQVYLVEDIHGGYRLLPWTVSDGEDADLDLRGQRKLSDRVLKCLSLSAVSIPGHVLQMEIVKRMSVPSEYVRNKFIPSDARILPLIAESDGKYVARHGGFALKYSPDQGLHVVRDI